MDVLDWQNRTPDGFYYLTEKVSFKHCFGAIY